MHSLCISNHYEILIHTLSALANRHKYKSTPNKKKYDPYKFKFQRLKAMHITYLFLPAKKLSKFYSKCPGVKVSRPRPSKSHQVFYAALCNGIVNRIFLLTHM